MAKSFLRELEMEGARLFSRDSCVSVLGVPAVRSTTDHVAETIEISCLCPGGWKSETEGQ